MSPAWRLYYFSIFVGALSTAWAATPFVLFFVATLTQLEHPNALPR